MGRGTRSEGDALSARVADATNYLYHYTDRDALSDIVRTCVLRPSDAQWGFGVYLTDLPPATPRPTLSQLFGKRRFYAERLEAYVRIARHSADADPHPADSHVFIAKGKVSLAHEPVEIALWRGGTDPDDQSGWASETVSRCAPDGDELRQAFERLLR